MGSPGGSVVMNLPANAGDNARVRSLGQEDPWEKEMATHFSILAWTEEPGRLQSMVSQKSGMTERLIHTFTKVGSHFPGGSVGKESACNAGDQGLIPGLGRSPGEGTGNALQYYCLKKSHR